MRAAGPCRKELHFPALGRAGKARAQSWVAQLHSGRFQQEVSPSPGDTVNAGSCSKPVLTLTPWTVVKTWAQVTLSLRRTRSAQSQSAFAEGFGGSVTTHITSVGSLLPNVPEQGRGKEAAGGCSPQPSWARSSSSNSCWHLLPSGLCWCRLLTPCTCLCKDFVFNSSGKPNHDFPVLSLVFLPPCFAFLLQSSNPTQCSSCFSIGYGPFS